MPRQPRPSGPGGEEIERVCGELLQADGVGVSRAEQALGAVAEAGLAHEPPGLELRPEGQKVIGRVGQARVLPGRALLVAHAVHDDRGPALLQEAVRHVGRGFQQVEERAVAVAHAHEQDPGVLVHEGLEGAIGAEAGAVGAAADRLGLRPDGGQGMGRMAAAQRAGPGADRLGDLAHQ